MAGLGIKIPKWGSQESYLWAAGGALSGAALYWILTGNKHPTGIGQIDSAIDTVGEVTHLEGIFPNTAPAALKPAPGKTTVIAGTPKAASTHPTPDTAFSLDEGGSITGYLDNFPSTGSPQHYQFTSAVAYSDIDARLSIA